MKTDYYIDIVPGDAPHSRIWLELIESAERGRTSSLHGKAEAYVIAKVLQAEAVDRLRRICPRATKFPRFVPVALPF